LGLIYEDMRLPKYVFYVTKYNDFKSVMLYYIDGIT